VTQKLFYILGSICALLSVILGAFGAHALKAKLTPEQIQSFETGVRYQFFHALALILLGLLLEKYTSQLLHYSGYCFIVGSILFCFSIYLLSCKSLLGIEGWSWLGPVTPLGGTLLILGWSMMVLYFIKK